MDNTVIDLHTIVELEERADLRRRQSRRDHDLAVARHNRRRRLRRALLIPAVVGWVIAVNQVVDATPVWWVAWVGALMSVPYLATFNLLGHPDW